MVRGLFQQKKNALVEGMADYFYLHTLNLLCRSTGRTALPDDIYITPCGGTKLVGHLASLFLGQNIRPLVLLDGDDAGRAHRDALMKELYVEQEHAVLMLSDVLGRTECEIEDILGETVLLPIVSEVVGEKLKLNDDDRKAGSLPDQLRAAASRSAITLPEGWKHEVARRLTIAWSKTSPESFVLRPRDQSLPPDVLDRAQSLFQTINERFSLSIEP